MEWQHTIDLIAGEAMLFAGLGLLVGGLDDLAIDILWWAHRLWQRGRPALTVATLPAPAHPGRLAVFIPAWDEAAVIGAMLTTALDRWRGIDLTIMVGTYPNDPATIAAVEAVAHRDARVRIVVGARPGPTTKADCLNGLWRALTADGVPAEIRAVVIHDAEDVVHPDEPAVYAALIGRAAVVQLPVLPLIHAGSAVSASYADDFAQAHATQMVVRTALGAGMPLAGTGCAIATAMLARLAAERGGLPFDPDSLVEDYELGLRIAAMGGQGLFARVLDGAGQPVAVRAYFPATLRAAVRQKTRWITGIALAGWDRTGWGRPLAMVEHWFRARDRRTPLAMIVLAAAWVAVPLWLAGAGWHVWQGTAPPPVGAMLTAILWANAALLAWRLAMRGYLTGRLYGWRQGVAAVPRVVVSNLIALLAAARAIVRYAGMLRGRPAAWDKTDHAFPVLIP